ncbi:hypothetical protein Hanom_Chr04g00335271 [Helianthus anomalus]
MLISSSFLFTCIMCKKLFWGQQRLMSESSCFCENEKFIFVYRKCAYNQM